jgi:DNA-binding LacI/PurR family transcriptional regulator
MVESRMTYQSKAVRLSRQMLMDIQNGCFEGGSVLPTFKELTVRYQASEPTVRRAMQILEGKHQLIKLPQRGLQVPFQSRQDGAVRSVPTSRLTIAAVWAGEMNYGVAKRLEGTKRYADTHGLKFTNYISQRHEDVLDALERIENYTADGVIVNPYRESRYLSVLEKLKEKKFPVVLTRSVGSLPLSTVMSNDSAGAYQASYYLIEKYHRPVYYLCEKPETEAATDRHQAYNNAMKDAGFGSDLEECTCPLDVSDADPQYWGLEKNWLPGFYAAEKLLERITLPASILCLNDFVAQGVYEAAAKRGLVIGKDLAVVGTDDLPLAQHLKPTLTTVHPSTEELGYEAGRLLHQIITKKVEPPVHIHLPVELIVRESA